MPVYLKQLSREAYCSAPPLPSSNIRPPRLTQFLEVKAEISSIESVEFGVEALDKIEDIKPEVKIRLDPRKVGDDAPGASRGPGHSAFSILVLVVRGRPSGSPRTISSPRATGRPAPGPIEDPIRGPGPGRPAQETRLPQGLQFAA